MANAGTDPDEAKQPTNDEGAAPWWAVVVALFVVAGALVGLVFLVRGVDPGPLKTSSSSGIVGFLFANRTVLICARLLLLATAGYAAWSIVILIRTGRPIVKAGGAETEQVAENQQGVTERLREDVDRLQRELRSATDDRRKLVNYIENHIDGQQEGLQEKGSAADDADNPTAAGDAADGHDQRDKSDGPTGPA